MQFITLQAEAPPTDGFRNFGILYYLVMIIFESDL